MLDYDSILAALKITFNALDEEIKMVAGWTFRDAGMDPIIVMIIDRSYDHFSGEGDPEDWRGIERRMITVQGNKGIGNIIIDYMEGW